MKHNSVISQKTSMPPIRRIVSAISIALSIVFALAAFGAIETSWTYQGQLRRSGAAYNGTCNFQFSLWNAESGGAQVGNTWFTQSVNVVNGLFTVPVDFGASAFEGPAQWLQTAVLCSGDGGFTQLNPRELITATPYALNLVPGTRIMGDNNITAFEATGQTGVKGICNWVNGSGVYGVGQTTDSVGVYGDNAAGVGVKGTGAFGVRGISNGSTASVGVRGDASGTTSVGIYGTASGTNSIAILGITSTSTAVYGQSTGSGAAIYGQALGTGKAGEFAGSVNVQGTLTKSAGSFRIDHPLDPANKFLSHSFVESPDMKNIYDGNITTDASGSATVTLPTYFESLNRDFRYQLTVLGQFAQAIVSRKIAGTTFEIRTDKPGVEVSWQVTGIRQDAYAKANPIVVEEFKSAEEKGLYLYPAGFGAGEEKRIGHSRRPEVGPGAPDQLGAAKKDQAEGK